MPPLTLLAAGLWATFLSSRVAPTWQALLVEALPMASLALALLLSIRFNRSRYTLLLLLIATAGLSQTWWRGQLLPATETLLFALLIANAFVVSLLRDRSLFSAHGLARIALLSLQGLALWLLATYTDLLPNLLLLDWFDLPAALALFVQLPDAVILPALAVCGAHAALSVARNSSLQATFFGCQLGLLGIASGYPHTAFAPVLVGCCALMVALAIVMDSHDMAYRDELTGLPSRRALNQLLMSLGRRYTIAMLDIDHFKKFNDTHGHDIGDEVLRMVASRIARVGGGGKAFRYGGEEFAIVFSGRSAKRAPTELESLRRDIEAYRMQVRAGNRGAGKKARKTRAQQSFGGKSLAVTVSIGFALRDTHSKHPESVIKAADQALYRAKRDGRNRVGQ
jgi:diguanylate cyclase (GGDEF)-like protein